MTSKQPKTYRVYVAQVNQTYVHVRALNADEAREKGYAKWRKEEAHSHISAVELAGELDSDG